MKNELGFPDASTPRVFVRAQSARDRRIHTDGADAPIIFASMHADRRIEDRRPTSTGRLPQAENGPGGRAKPRPRPRLPGARGRRAGRPVGRAAKPPWAVQIGPF